MVEVETGGEKEPVGVVASSSRLGEPPKRTGLPSALLTVQVPGLRPDEKDAEITAFEDMKQVPLRILSAFLSIGHGLLLFLLGIGRLLALPLILWQSRTTPEQRKVSIGVVMALVISGVIAVFVVPLDTVARAVGGQVWYKVWSLYNVLIIVRAHTLKMQRFAHRALRGAVRSGGGAGFAWAVAVKTLVNVVQYLIVACENGCYVAGQWGKARMFISALLHLSIVVMKKMLSKPLEGSPALLIVHCWLASGFAALWQFAEAAQEVPRFLIFEGLFTAARIAFVTLTDDGVKFCKAISDGVGAISMPQFGAQLDKSLIAVIPLEAWALMFIGLAISRHWWVGMISCGLLGAAGFLIKPEQKIKPAPSGGLKPSPSVDVKRQD